MLPPSDQNISKYLSYVLRHKPENIGLHLDNEGWASVEDLLDKSQEKWPTLTLTKLQHIVATDDKGRYSFSTDGTRIRAVQGHSTDKVQMKLQKAVPPVVLYHGTPPKFQAPIESQGLQKQQRHHVHLSADLETAVLVGKRRHKDPVIFKVDAAAMLRDGHIFYLSENSVWLVDAVPSKYLSL
jgi:putative RNA 2'-phosphotransferase